MSLRPDLRDLHVYGGILLAGAGLGAVRWWLALVVVGFALAYLGLRRV